MVPAPSSPEILSPLERIFPHYSRRHLVKPGVTGWAQVRCGYAGSELETVAIAAKDAHRPMRVPESQFVFGRELGIDTTEDEAGGVPEPDQAEPAIDRGSG